jgi:exodeoxyribonuclease III
VRLVSWNVSGRVKRLGEQAERLLSLDADVICLQEVTATTAPLWRSALDGWSVALADLGVPRSRPLGVLTAARSTGPAPVPVADLPWPERVVSAVVDGVEVVNVHSPISPKPDLAKVRTHEAVFAHLARPAPHPRLVCGDLNTPRREHPDGSAWTFARTRSGNLRPDRGERWDVAELALIKGLEAHGFRDAWRERHGHEKKEPSWEWPRWGGGYRLDHLICSAELAVDRCEYTHDWRREDKLSDHSALLADLSVRR